MPWLGGTFGRYHNKHFHLQGRERKEKREKRERGSIPSALLEGCSQSIRRTN
jgi:hypothetical protein